MSEYTDRLVQQTEAMLHFRHDETLTETSPERLHEALSDVIMMEINDRWSRTRHTQQNGRRAYYFSAEYLIGRLIYSNLFNLGILNDIKESFAAKGVDLACLEEIEDAALGNGGLGRLAACFLDSAATLDLPLMGYGLRYRFGLFKQTFENDRQRENADDWTKYGDPWSHRRDKLTVKVKFADQTVNCVPYDMPVIGYDTETVGTLRLWQCEAEKELDFDAFNAQDYYKALENKNKAEDITRVLYPNDSTWEGKRLRIKQQYVLSSASLQNIMRDFRKHQGLGWDRLPEFAAIQLNDTHPAMSIPELIRLLMAEGLDFDAAFNIAARIFSYTNHTVMSEALEKWDMELLRSVVPEICARSLSALTRACGRSTRTPISSSSRTTPRTWRTCRSMCPRRSTAWRRSIRRSCATACSTTGTRFSPTASRTRRTASRRAAGSACAIRNCPPSSKKRLAPASSRISTGWPS